MTCTCLAPALTGQPGAQWCTRCRRPVETRAHVTVITSGERRARLYELPSVDPVLVQPCRIGGEEA